LTELRLAYKGDSWAIYYLPIDDFVKDLEKLEEVLDKPEREEGKVVAVAPNIGLTKTSLVFGTSFQGVKGFAADRRGDKAVVNGALP